MTYDAQPTILAGSSADCIAGIAAIANWIHQRSTDRICIDAYPGVHTSSLMDCVQFLDATIILDTADAMLPHEAIVLETTRELTDDPVFGKISRKEMVHFFDLDLLSGMRRTLQEAKGTAIVIGPGAALFSEHALLIYADLGRREATLRQRHGTVSNLGLQNRGDPPSAMYKRSYFVDWRIADRHKRSLWDRIDAFLDTTTPDAPILVESETLYMALTRIAHQPFRVVPWFDPAPWGGTWMQDNCVHDHADINLGWCFDCVPEENSLLLAFGSHIMDIPSVNLVYREPKALLGEAVYGRFGAEFPIRTDFLDTINGGNLSLQVHPLVEYMHEHFGLAYTQDESYYILDALPGAAVHLGLRDGVNKADFIQAIQEAESSATPFPHEQFVNIYPTKRHDHFLIPAGTIHGSAANTMVLEISSTPYIFTFKMYDWLRPGLDGKPRPIHIDRALANVVWERDASYAQEHLVNHVSPIASGEGWKEERTGLHSAEFIETRRHWFSTQVLHQPTGSVEVLNLVEGDAVVIESPDHAFAPFWVHYAETFIVPDAAGPYSIRPQDPNNTKLHATIKAYVRTAG